MANYTDLKAAIRQVIKANDNQEITGQIMQDVLLSIVNSIDSGALFAGIAVPTTNPGTPDCNVFYLASQAGTYVNFGQITVPENSIYIISNQTGSWIGSSVYTAPSLQVVQTTGDSTSDVMSQKAVTDEIDKSATILNNDKSDLDITDENSFVIARFENGGIKTKNFNSSELSLKIADSIKDFEIADENGNVILRLNGGHIQTRYFNSDDISINKTQWYGKKWYAYGTSLTNTSREGKYAAFVEQYSGMIRTNKGISGGALVANRNIYNAIMNTTDGKTEADLITLECLANDDMSPFGTVTDTDNTTFLGSLGQCIAYLQQNTTAQIVILSSMRGRRNVANTQQFYPYDDENYTNKCMSMEKLCLMYGVHYINPNHAMGYYRKTDAYYVDNIHHTALGGKVFADYIWGKLKVIPLWLT